MKIKQKCQKCFADCTFDSKAERTCPKCSTRQTYEQEYNCNGCGVKITLEFYDGIDQPKDKLECPHCHGHSLDWIPPKCWFKFSDPEGTKRWNSSHDYRFKHNYEKPGGVRDQRSEAEQKSHMGPTPYVDNTEDDLNLGLGTHDII